MRPQNGTWTISQCFLVVLLVLALIGGLVIASLIVGAVYGSKIEKHTRHTDELSDTLDEIKTIVSTPHPEPTPHPTTPPVCPPANCFQALHTDHDQIKDKLDDISDLVEQKCTDPVHDCEVIMQADLPKTITEGGCYRIGENLHWNVGIFSGNAITNNCNDTVHLYFDGHRIDAMADATRVIESRGGYGVLHIHDAHIRGSGGDDTTDVFHRGIQLTTGHLFVHGALIENMAFGIMCFATSFPEPQANFASCTLEDVHISYVVNAGKNASSYVSGFIYPRSRGGVFSEYGCPLTWNRGSVESIFKDGAPSLEDIARCGCGYVGLLLLGGEGPSVPQSRVAAHISHVNMMYTSQAIIGDGNTEIIIDNCVLGQDDSGFGMPVVEFGTFHKSTTAVLRNSIVINRGAPGSSGVKFNHVENLRMENVDIRGSFPGIDNMPPRMDEWFGRSSMQGAAIHGDGMSAYPSFHRNAKLEGVTVVLEDQLSFGVMDGGQLQTADVKSSVSLSHSNIHGGAASVLVGPTSGQFQTENTLLDGAYWGIKAVNGSSGIVAEHTKLTRHCIPYEFDGGSDNHLLDACAMSANGGPGINNGAGSAISCLPPVGSGTTQCGPEPPLPVWGNEPQVMVLSARSTSNVRDWKV